MPSLADDLSEMAAYGSFMFLLNELRNLAAEADATDDEERGEEGGDGNKDLFASGGGGNNPASADRNLFARKGYSTDRNPFAPILKFPLHPSTMDSVVRSNADRLIELQGEKRHEAHLQMFDYFQNRDCSAGRGGGGNDDEEAQKNSDSQSSEPIFLDYNEERAKAKGEDHLVYSLVLDHAKRRLVVVFRGSVTVSDWAANRDAFFVTVDNPLYVGGDSDDKGNEVDANGQPRQLVLHRGFYEYVHKSIEDEEDEGDGDDKVESQGRQQTMNKNAIPELAESATHPTNDAIPGQDQPAPTKMDEIVAKTKAILDDHPGYEVFTTGVSLGGALTTVFAFFAAARYPELGPITCFSFASPKVGTLSFRMALQKLEADGKLKIVRVCNYADPVILLPKEPLSIIPCDAVLSTFFLGVRQSLIYRHVGLRIHLEPQPNHPAQISHTKLEHRFCRTFLSDIAKVWGRLFICLAYVVCFWHTFSQNYRANHGYPEYWYRVQTHLGEFEDLTLQGLYDEFLSDDRTHVKTIFM